MSLRWWIISFALKYFPCLTQVHFQFTFFWKCYCSFIVSYLKNFNCNNKLSFFFSAAWLILSCGVLRFCISNKMLRGTVPKIELTCLEVCWHLWCHSMEPAVPSGGWVRAEVTGACWTGSLVSVSGFQDSQTCGSVATDGKLHVVCLSSFTNAFQSSPGRN